MNRLWRARAAAGAAAVSLSAGLVLALGGAAGAATTTGSNASGRDVSFTAGAANEGKACSATAECDAVQVGVTGAVYGQGKYTFADGDKTETVNGIKLTLSSFTGNDGADDSNTAIITASNTTPTNTNDESTTVAVDFVNGATTTKAVVPVTVMTDSVLLQGTTAAAGGGEPLTTKTTTGTGVTAPTPTPTPSVSTSVSPTPTPTRTSHPGTWRKGHVYSSYASGMCLDAKNTFGTAKTTTLQLWQCGAANSEDQVFTYAGHKLLYDDRHGNDTYCVSEVAGTLKAMLLSPCDNAATQYVTYTGGQYVWSGPKVLDDGRFGKSDGTQVYIYPRNGGGNQYWSLPR